MSEILFYLFSAIAVISALGVITFPKPTRALLSLIVTMFALAVLYLVLGAPFVAMAHLIVYAGAVLVLFLFVIMLQGIGASDIPLWQRFFPGFVMLSGFAAAAFFGLVGFLFFRHTLPGAQTVHGAIETVGRVLFTKYLLPFEVTSLLLLVGVFAAVALAKRETE